MEQRGAECHDQVFELRTTVGFTAPRSQRGLPVQAYMTHCEVAAVDFVGKKEGLLRLTSRFLNQHFPSSIQITILDDDDNLCLSSLFYILLLLIDAVGCNKPICKQNISRSLSSTTRERNEPPVACE